MTFSPLAWLAVLALCSACSGGEAVDESNPAVSGGCKTESEYPALHKATGSDPVIKDYEDPRLELYLKDFDTGHDDMHVSIWQYWDAGWIPEIVPNWAIVRPGHGGSWSHEWKYTAACDHPDVGAENCWGGGTGFDFVGCYDASVYAGITMWVRGQGAGSVLIEAPCLKETGERSWCKYQAPDPEGQGLWLTDDWVEIRKEWHELTHPETGTTLDPTRLNNINFFMWTNVYGANDFDLFVDDIEFIEKVE